MNEQKRLHQFYIALREMMCSGAAPKISVQRSFDAVMDGYRAEDSWRPSHVTPAAAGRLVSGGTRGVQRAHGALVGRLDRYERTVRLLEGPELEFEDWWSEWTTHDATVLVTREEHVSGRKFDPSEVMHIPPDLKLFGAAGFNFKFRKGHERAWLESWV